MTLHKIETALALLASQMLFSMVGAASPNNDTQVVVPILDMDVCYRLYRADDERYGSSCKTGYSARERAFETNSRFSDDPLYCQRIPVSSDSEYSECHETTLRLPVDLSGKDDTFPEYQTVLNISDAGLLAFLGEPEDANVEFRAKFDLVEQRICSSGGWCVDPMVFPITKCEHLAMYPGKCQGPMVLPIEMDESFVTDEYIQERNEYINDSNICPLANPASNSVATDSRMTTVVVSSCTKFGNDGLGTCGDNDTDGFDHRFTVTLRGQLMERVRLQGNGNYRLQRQEDGRMCLATTYSTDDTVGGTGSEKCWTTCVPVGGTDVFRKYQLTKAYSSSASGAYEVFNKVEVFDGSEVVEGSSSGDEGDGEGSSGGGDEGVDDQGSTSGALNKYDITSNNSLVVAFLLLLWV